MSTVAERAAQKMAATNREPQRPAVEPLPTANKIGTGFINGPLARDSQPFSYTKAMTCVVLNKDDHGLRDKAKHEADVLDKFSKAMNDANPSDRHRYWLPMNFDAVQESAKDTAEFRYVKAVIEGSGQASDPNEEEYLIRKGVMYRKTQSAYIDTLGGSLVPPPTMGDVIPLIRPSAALLAAGAQGFPLPPGGRHVRGRITGAPSVTAVAESQEATETNLSTDQMELTARKIAGASRLSKESVAFTSGTMDNYVRAELGRSLGLKIDAYGFYGTGGTSIPAGLTSAAYTGSVINLATSYPTARGIGTNGNTLLPQYGDAVPALIGERSFSMDAGSGKWVMRPGAYAAAMGVRADAVTPGDEAGPLVDILKRFSESAPNQWRGKQVVQTTNIRGDRTKGSGTNLQDVFFGLWQHCIVASYGAVAFEDGHDGTSFKKGEYIVLATMYGDIGFEYPTAFLWYQDVIGVSAIL